jgi:DNA-binding NarL/FixJ family response regulator
MTSKTPTPVFIVDNTNLFVKMLEYVFSKDIQYQFRDFKSAEDCLTHLDTRPAIVIIDDILPGMDGYQALRKIKKKSPDTHVILLIDERNSKRGGEAIAAGADDYIIKESHLMDTITEKLETFFNKRTQIMSVSTGVKGARGLIAVCFFILILVLASAGIYYY